MFKLYQWFDKSYVILAAFQIAYTDFELELMKNEEESMHDEDSLLNSDEDLFVTSRRHNRVKFTDNIIQKPLINFDNSNAISERINMSTQTAR